MMAMQGSNGRKYLGKTSLPDETNGSKTATAAINAAVAASFRREANATVAHATNEIQVKTDSDGPNPSVACLRNNRMPGTCPGRRCPSKALANLIGSVHAYGHQNKNPSAVAATNRKALLARLPKGSE